LQEHRPRHKRGAAPGDIGAALLLIAFAAWFLWRLADGLDYRWDWSAAPGYILRRAADGGWKPGLLLDGLVTTLRLSVLSSLLALTLGLVMGLLRISPNRFRRLVAGAYVGLIRNTPPLVVVFVFYFFLSDMVMAALHVDQALASLGPEAKGWLSVLIGPPETTSSFLSAVLTLGLFEGAYITEIVRSGVQSVDDGQWEAARSLGFSRGQTLFRVVLPQALRHMLPALAGQFISTIKDSAIVSVISVRELTFQGMELMAATYRTFEIWITVTLLYFCLTFACSLAVRRIELRLRRNGGQTF